MKNEMKEILLDSSQSFSDWNYIQRIEAVKYSEKMMKEYSQQGRRTDLERKKEKISGDETSVQTRQKLERQCKQITTRDKMAHVFGISTATYSKYRRIIKLSDELLDPLVRFLEEKKITFEMVYIIANMRELEIKLFIEYRNKLSDRKVDLEKLKKLPHKNDQFAPKSIERVKDVFVAVDSNSILFKRKR